MKQLLSVLNEFPDPRRKGGNFRHKLTDILILALCAVMAGARDFENMAFYCSSREAFFRKVLDLPHGTPSADTFQRTLERVSPDEFQRYISMARQILKDKWQIVNIDGKTIRRSGNSKHDPYHVVSAYIKERMLTLGQVVTEEKSNEITAIPKLLDLIDVTGDVVTIDAMGTQIEIAKKIIEKKADYILAVKGNQKELLDAITDCFKEQNPIYTTTEKGHGRHEKREYFLYSDPEFISWLSNKKWAGLKAVGRVRSTVTQKGRTSVVDRYYITTLTDIEKFAKSVRGHWGIESMHWILDVVFGEDTCCARKDHSAKNMNILRKTALTLLKEIKMNVSRPSIRGKMMAVALNPDEYLTQIF